MAVKQLEPKDCASALCSSSNLPRVAAWRGGGRSSPKRARGRARARARRVARGSAADAAAAAASVAAAVAVWASGGRGEGGGVRQQRGSREGEEGRRGVDGHEGGGAGREEQRHGDALGEGGEEEEVGEGEREAAEAYQRCRERGEEGGVARVTVGVARVGVCMVGARAGGSARVRAWGASERPRAEGCAGAREAGTHRRCPGGSSQGHPHASARRTRADTPDKGWRRRG